MFNPGSAGYFVPTMPQAQRSYFPQMAQMRATPRWPAQPQMRPGTQPAAGRFPVCKFVNSNLIFEYNEY